MDNRLPVYFNRFFYTGNKPKDHIFGLDQITERTDKIILCSGERDLLNLASAGYSAVCLNSETADLNQDQYKSIAKKCNEIYLVLDIDETFPVIVTTSKLLSTGVDVPTCKNVVLFRHRMASDARD